jgi:hypothetical protein
MTKRKAPFPGFVEPALASSIEKVPAGDRWIHEVKFDGYRVQVRLANTTVRVQFGVVLPLDRCVNWGQKLIDAMNHDAAVLKQKEAHNA